MEIFLVALAGLTVLVLAAMFSRRTGIAAPLLLLALGIAAGVTPALPNVELAPEVTLAGVLPPLLYASSSQMPLVDLRRNLRMISWLGVVMVLVTALVVGGVVHLVFPEIPFALAVALGAVVSPTDAVAATAIGKRLGLPHRLMTVLEGESLFNDAAALVTLRTAVAALAASFSFWQAAGTFVWASTVGVAVGLLVGVAAVGVRSRLGDPVLTTTVSFAVPWIAFFPAEEVGASGIIAVVVAGLVAGHRGRTRLSATERATEATTWASVNFVLENAVFLVMGLAVAGLVEDSRADGGFDHLVELCVLVFVLLGVLRVVGVGVPLVWQRLRLHPERRTRLRERLSLANERVRELEEQQRLDEDRVAEWNRYLDVRRADLDFAEREPVTRRGGVVLAWAGMRGVVTLAAAQTIDTHVAGAPTPYRSTIVLVAFLVAVASLVIFGGTLPWVIRRLQFEPPSAHDQRAELFALMNDLGAEATAVLGPLSEQRLDGEPLDPAVAELVRRRFGPLMKPLEDAADLPRSRPGVREQTMRVQRRYLDELRAALTHEQAVGAYSTQALTHAQRLLDEQEQRFDAMQ
ncbi:cation:proton antiporter [Mobilicoccus pelagius]|uniref:Putative CPA1 family transporter n=1 Tax=Mobilicoccus pelagius NBRC 104925 TaxID=1089455 RepID=H5UPM2_9MICO|nr:sodium:proton antiporter [Mobilicoccus pelagius]GAB47680.1 putative CPA1 family transporter [Mobilicoccus pelagius NBRC 104925]